MIELPELPQHIQDCFVYLVIYDLDFIKAARHQVNPTHFDSDVVQDIVRLCYKYYDNFKEPINENLFLDLKNFISNINRREKELYYKYIEKINKITPPNVGYIISKISDFVKQKEFEQAADNFTDLIERKRFDDARSLMLTALKAGITKYERGLEYASTKVPTYHLKENEILMTTGITELDRIINGYKREEFICFLGGAKGKKTWSLVHLGKQALRSGLNVVHITHEVSAEEVEKRYDMSFGSLTSEYNQTDVTYRYYDENGLETNKNIILRDTVNNIDAVLKVRDKIKSVTGRLMIKKYPMGSCTMTMIEQYLDYLELYENFIPDVVINDYVDIMSLGGSDNIATRDKLNNAYIMHKKLADERNILVATVSQANRQAIRKETMSMKDFAEDIRKAANVDLAIALVETDEEAESGIMRLWVLANRTGLQDRGCGISLNLQVGQFAIDSWRI